MKITRHPKGIVFEEEVIQTKSQKEPFPQAKLEIPICDETDVFIKDRCVGILTRGPCNVGEWITINSETGEFIITNVRCPICKNNSPTES